MYGSGNVPALAIAVGDVTQDGVVDVVVAARGDTLVFPGMGSGVLGAPQPLQAGSATPSFGVLIADVNGDGKNDIVTLDANALAFLQTSPGTFAAPISVAFDPDPSNGGLTGHFTHSGAGAPADVLLTGQSGGPDFTAQLFTLGSSGSSFVPSGSVAADGDLILVADVDQDGFDDVVFDTGDGQTEVAYGGAATFSTVDMLGSAGCYGFAAGHYTQAESGLDIALCSPSLAGCVLFEQTSPRVFAQTAAPVASVNIPAEGLGADLNGDGRDDIEIFNQYALQCPGSGAGTFFPSTGAPAQIPDYSPGLTQIIDVNGDGKPDIVTANGFQLPLEVFLQQ